jgi:hypothetical protein
MEVTICVPKGADISILESEYPDIYEDEGWDDHDRYFVGKSDDGLKGKEAKEARSFLTYSEAIKCCGFAEGAIEGCDTALEGSGEWAMSMLRRDNFKNFAADEKTIRKWKRHAGIWRKAFKRGEAARKSNER